LAYVEKFKNLQNENETNDFNILDNNPARVKQLCYSVGKLFSKTNDLGKTYINNLFILPVTLMIEADFKNRKQFLNLFPMNLKSEYVKQIYHSGI